MLGSIRHLKNLICCEVALNSRSLTSSIVLRALLISDSLLIQDGSELGSEFQWNQTSIWLLRWNGDERWHFVCIALRTLSAPCAFVRGRLFSQLHCGLRLSPIFDAGSTSWHFTCQIQVMAIYIEQLTVNERRNFQIGRKKTLCLNENSLWSNERSNFFQRSWGTRVF